MQTETKDFMSGILAQSQKDTKKGIGPKSKKQNSILDILGEESLEIVDSPIPNKLPTKAVVSDWKTIKVRGNSFSIPVDLWGEKKFFSYFRYLCCKKDKSLRDKIASSIGPALYGRFIKKIKEELEKKLEHAPTNLLLRNYIEWFVENEINIERFSLYDVSSKRSVARFIAQNKHKEREMILSSLDIDISRIQEYYDSGGVAFLMNYGIVICFNWLFSEKGLSPKETKEILEQFYKDAAKSGNVFTDQIVSVTKRMSPYLETFNNSHLIDLLKNLSIDGISFTNK